MLRISGQGGQARPLLGPRGCSEPGCPGAAGKGVGLCPHLSRSGSRRSPPGRRTGRPRRRSRTGLRAGRGWSRRRPPLENTQRVGPSGKGVSGGGRRGQREEGKGRRRERPGRGGVGLRGEVPLALGRHAAAPHSSPRGLAPQGSVQQGHGGCLSLCSLKAQGLRWWKTGFAGRLRCHKCRRAPGRLGPPHA